MCYNDQVLWLMIVLASLAVATIFLYTAVVDFTSSTVVSVSLSSMSRKPH